MTGYADGRIFFQASDNVMVTKVDVMVLDPERAGEVMEQGDSIRGEGDWWEYLPKLAGKTIAVAAWDLAGNVTKDEDEKQNQ